MPKAYKEQNYASLKKACLKNGVLFEDTLFPADSKAIGHSTVQADIEWKRPKEICKVPQLVVDGLKSDDLVCDDVSRSWFPAACMDLVREPKLWHRVVPDSAKQEWSEKNEYAGIFKFSLWRFGEWMDVVIDDRLPVRGDKLVFCRSTAKNEFWSALLEKAYAKLFGDYESMENGTSVHTLVDFTGGVAEIIDLKSPTYCHPSARPSVFNKLVEARENSALLNCHLEDIVTPEEEENSEKPKDERSVDRLNLEGLVPGMEYNITKVLEIQANAAMTKKLGTSLIRLVRLFAPQGNTWTGPWSEKSSQMAALSFTEWEKLGVKYNSEGDFWMSLEDFMSMFRQVSICHVMNTSFFSLKKTWNQSVLFSSWKDGQGCEDWNSNDILRNPQFMLDIPQDQDSLIVSLEQRDVKGDGQSGTVTPKVIGFHIMKVEENRKYRCHVKGDLMMTSEFTATRSIYGCKKLPKGRHVIILCGKNIAAGSRLMIRLFATSHLHPVELVKDCPSTGCCLPSFQSVCTLHVTKVDGIALPATEKGTLDPYIVIRCEGNKVQSDFQKNTNCPKFDLKATFYRKNPKQNITIEIYSHNILKNSFLGEARIDVPENTDSSEEGEEKVFDVFGRKKEAAVQKPGKVYVLLRASFDLALL